MSRFEDYDSPNHHKYTISNSLYQHHLRQIMQRTTEMVVKTDPETVLDAGCGEGFVTKFMKERYPALVLTGVDLSEPAIEYAQHHFGEQGEFVRGNLFDLPFDDNAFDVVLCSEVLEHLPEPGRAVKELRRVASDAVVITVPREPYFKWLNDLGRFLGMSPDPGHVNFWNKKGFQEFINQFFQHTEFAWKHIYQLAHARL